MTGEDRPILVVIAGPNGSGKTTITRQLIEHIWTDDCLYINPDDIAENEFGGWNNKGASKLAADKAEALREQALLSKQSLVFETVFSTQEKLDFVIKACRLGYFVRVFFVCTQRPAINIARISQRYMEGGHFVAPDKVEARFYRALGFAAQIAPLVNRFYYYDNSVDDREAELVFKVKDGVLSKTYIDSPREPALMLINTFGS